MGSNPPPPMSQGHMESQHVVGVPHTPREG